MLRFRHSGNLGDIIYSLPTIIAFGGGELLIDAKVQPNELHADAIPPTAMTNRSVEELLELLRLQPYISRADIYRGETVDVNLNLFRNQLRWPEHLAHVYLRTFRQQFDLTQPWLQAGEPLPLKDIVIAHSGRYLHRLRLQWDLLKHMESRCLFIGDEEQHAAFSRHSGLLIERAAPMSILMFARVIRGSRMFIGNQSLGFALAEALKHPRVLEVCLRHPNCIPQSCNGYTRLRPALKRFFSSSGATGCVAERRIVVCRNIFWWTAYAVYIRAKRVIDALASARCSCTW